jgi:hypothetical protein
MERYEENGLAYAECNNALPNIATTRRPARRIHMMGLRPNTLLPDAWVALDFGGQYERPAVSASRAQQGVPLCKPQNGAVAMPKGDDTCIAWLVAARFPVFGTTLELAGSQRRALSKISSKQPIFVHGRGHACEVCTRGVGLVRWCDGCMMQERGTSRTSLQARVHACCQHNRLTIFTRRYTE